MQNPVTVPSYPLTGMHLSAAVAEAMGLGKPELMTLPHQVGFTETYIIRADRCPYSCEIAGCDHEHWTRAAGLYAVKPYAFEIGDAWEVLRWVAQQDGDLYFAFIYGLGIEAAKHGLENKLYAWHTVLLEMADGHKFPDMLCRALLYGVANRERWAGCQRPRL